MARIGFGRFKRYKNPGAMLYIPDRVYTDNTFPFEEGEIVKITDGPFKEQEGKVAEVDEEHGKIKVLVPIFGRDTMVELDSLQVKRL